MNLTNFYKSYSQGSNSFVTTAVIFMSFLILCKIDMLMSENGGYVSCKCGHSSKEFMAPCDNNCTSELTTCLKFKSCKTCKDGSRTCVSCPRGLHGPNCEQPSAMKKKNPKALKYEVKGYKQRRVKRSQCQSLRPPKAGQVTCWSNHEGKECTSTCIPGYKFQNRHETTIVLRCSEGMGRWEPERNFPACVSTGECDLEMAGAGRYNCTSTTVGTNCDVKCGQDYGYTRYFCYPGKRWEPSLPNCVRRKGGVVVQPVTTPPPPPPTPYDCRCQNGGTCDAHARTCRCPEGTRGRYCQEFYSTVKCPDPGYVRNGDRINSGPLALRGNGVYEEGASVVYSCRHGYALIGSSLLTCESSGYWSFSKPTCQRIPDSTTTTTTAKPAPRRFCKDPGFIEYGDRWTAEGRASSRGDVFEVGKSVAFSCRNGYALEGLSLISCLDTLQWSNVLPQCKTLRVPTSSTTEAIYEPIDDDDDLYCPDPGSDENAIRTERPWLDAKRKPADDDVVEYPPGFQFTFKCKDGYKMHGKSTINCLYTGSWSDSPPICIPSFRQGDVAYCQDPGEIKNAVKLVITMIDERKRDGIMKRNKNMEYPDGVKLRFICMDGYQIVGRETIQCTNTGEWDASPPRCV